LRAALGATSRRVFRQLLTESVTLALLGAAAGIGFAYFAVRAFTRSSLVTLPRIEEVTVDGRVLAITLAVSVVSGILFGLLPALHGVRARLTSDATAGTRESSHRSVRRFNNALVVAQLSLSVVLLVAAGLVLKSFQRLTHVDLGFKSDGVTSIAIALPPRYNNAVALPAFLNTAVEQVRAIPGVRAATFAWSLPFEGNINVDGYLVEGRPVPPSGNEDQIDQNGVAPGYFAMLGIPLLYGRDFTPADDTLGLPVAIINESLAKRYWNGADAIGKRIRTTGDTTWLTIVGIVGDVRDQDAATPPMPQMYVSIPQAGGTQLSLAIKTSGEIGTVLPALRRAISSIEPSIPLDGVRPLTTVVDRSLDTRRLTKILLGAFALLAVTLAGVGVYGVMSLSVANRTREFGVRLAVGAAPQTLVRLVLREGAMLAMAGVVIGIGGALIVTRWISSLLYEVSPTDPLVFASLPLLLAAIAVASCLVPARRAAKSDPLAVLRSD
ncbi:MAG TPA: FtsX-like permease family protein, partial [Gemmatimonadaceae bacterium]